MLQVSPPLQVTTHTPHLPFLLADVPKATSTGQSPEIHTPRTQNPALAPPLRVQLYLVCRAVASAPALTSAPLPLPLLLPLPAAASQTRRLLWCFCPAGPCPDGTCSGWSSSIPHHLTVAFPQHFALSDVDLVEGPSGARGLTWALHCTVPELSRMPGMQPGPAITVTRRKAIPQLIGREGQGFRA